MSRQAIGIGSAANDGTGDPLRTAFQKANANDAELYARTFFGYFAGKAYVPFAPYIYTNGGTATNSIRLIPFIVFDKITIDTLYAVVTTAESAKSIQLAIYGSDANGKATGNALASTGSLSLASTGLITGAVTSVQLTPGLYWFARNSDSAGTAQTVNVSNSAVAIGGLVGSSTPANVLGAAGAGLTGFAVSQTFGTWPDLTAVTPAESNNSSAGPVPFFKVASVP